MFSHWDSWNVIAPGAPQSPVPYYSALYFTWVTLLTIGFGDYVPGFGAKNFVGRLQICALALYIVVGLVRKFYFIDNIAKKPKSIKGVLQ